MTASSFALNSLSLNPATNVKSCKDCDFFLFPRYLISWYGLTLAATNRANLASEDPVTTPNISLGGSYVVTQSPRSAHPTFRSCRARGLRQQLYDDHAASRRQLRQQRSEWDLCLLRVGNRQRRAALCDSRHTHGRWHRR